MFSFRNYIVLCALLCTCLLSGMSNKAKKHIISEHVYDESKLYKDIVYNKNSGALSAINEDGKRKTFFSEMSNEGQVVALNEDQVISLINKCNKNKECLCTSQTKDHSRLIEYKQEGAATITCVKDAKNHDIITLYPRFRYISQAELLSYENLDDKIYLGTIKNSKNEFEDIEYSVKDIKKFAKNGCKKAENKNIFTMDISRKIFGSALFDGHILVEMDKK